MNVFFDPTDDFSLNSSDNMDMNQQNINDSNFHDDVIFFPNEFDFHHQNQIDPTSFMNNDHSQFSEFSDQGNDFPNHITIDHVDGFSHENGLHDYYHNDESNNHQTEMHFGQTSFSGKYTDAEISKLKEDVSNYQYEVNHLHDEVHHHENMVSLADTKKGHENGDYANEVADLGKVESRYNYAVGKLNNAIEKLNNAT